LMPSRSARALSSIRAAMTKPPSVSRGLRGGVFRKSRARSWSFSLFIAEIVSLSFFRYLIGDKFRRRWSRTGTTSGLEHDISMRDHSLSSSVSSGKLAGRALPRSLKRNPRASELLTGSNFDDSMRELSGLIQWWCVEGGWLDCKQHLRPSRRYPRRRRNNQRQRVKQQQKHSQSGRFSEDAYCRWLYAEIWDFLDRHRRAVQCSQCSWKR